MMACSKPVTIGRFVYDYKHGGRIKRYFLVPCGHCLDCLKVRQQQYAFRAEWQALDPRSLTILFCTFTYAPEYLPADNELSKDEMQRYIRRLRKSLPDVSVKYMICGEYGEKYGRAHYHAILYFDAFIDYKPVVDAWPFGIVNIAPFTNARGGYVAKYSVKQLGDVSEHRQEPFILVSNGLGFYFLDVHGDYCRKNYIGSWENLSGYPVFLPRVFLERLFPPKDKLHFERSLESDAKFLYYSRLAGNVGFFRGHRKFDYDRRLRIETALSKFDNSALYAEHKSMNQEFKHSNRVTAILNRCAYEIGRY